MITRRTALLSGLSTFSIVPLGIASAQADFGGDFVIGEGLEDFWLATGAYI